MKGIPPLIGGKSAYNWLLTFALSSTLLLGALATAEAQSTSKETANNPKTGKEEVISLSPFQISETKSVGYRTTQTLSGSATVAELRDIPSSISIMNRELMDDLMVTRVKDLVSFSISGEAEPANEAALGGGALNVRMRGLVSGSLRDGVYMPASLDSHNVDRVEILRGPNGFLYTGAGAGGNPNQVTKRAQRTDAQQARVIVGSSNLYRAEADINRVLTDTLSIRTSMAYEDSNRFQNYASRDFRGIFVTANYRPFSRTNIDLSFDYGRNYEIMSPAMLSDQFSTTDRTGATVAYTTTSGGVTLLPGPNRIYDTVGQLRTIGTNLTLSDGKIVPDKANFKGPNSFNNTIYSGIDLTVDHSFSETLSFRFRALRTKWETHAREGVGASAASIYKDLNPLLPNGAANPNLGQSYTEYFHRELKFEEPSDYYQLTGLYDLKLSFTTQRIVGAGHYHGLSPHQLRFSEFINPTSPSFKGALREGQTLGAYVDNNTTLNQNRLYRRFYLRDGDSARITGWSALPELTSLRRDTIADGNLGRLFDRYYWNAGGSFGSAGSYFNERFHTFVGWRSDSFFQTPGRLFYDQVSGAEYRLATSPNTRTRVRGDSTNYGVVFHVTKFLSIYGNYGESLSLNVTAGQPGLLPGITIPSPKGFGEDYGLRWEFLEGRIQSSWTYYRNKRLSGATIPANVLTSELAVLFRDINPSALDTENVTAEGIEFDTILNLTPNWRLIWNYSSNDLANTERYLSLISVRQRARTQNVATPLTDAFLLSVPEGTPSVGFTAARSNLVTQYRFDKGPLDRVMIGAFAQYREETYQGNFDLNRDGFAEQIWTPGYTVAGVMLGYRARIANRSVDFNLNVNNVLDKRYFRATALSSGAIGEPRQFRLMVRLDL